MKKTILCALMLAGFAAQGASAAIRTFDFTATVTGVRDFNNWQADTVYLPYDGITVTLGDTIKGTFSFDDLGHDWTAAGSPVQDQPVTSFQYTFLDSNYTVTPQGMTWSHDNDYFGKSTFILWNNRGFHPTADFEIRSPVDAFSWNLGNGTTGSFVGSYSQDGPPHYLFFGVTGLSEVSPVPEPATWGMMLMGLGAVGAAAYRRRKAA